jgi:hypothetical protein
MRLLLLSFLLVAGSAAVAQIICTPAMVLSSDPPQHREAVHKNCEHDLLAKLNDTTIRPEFAWLQFGSQRIDSVLVKCPGNLGISDLPALGFHQACKHFPGSLKTVYKIPEHPYAFNNYNCIPRIPFASNRWDFLCVHGKPIHLFVMSESGGWIAFRNKGHYDSSLVGAGVNAQIDLPIGQGYGVTPREGAIEFDGTFYYAVIKGKRVRLIPENTIVTIHHKIYMDPYPDSTGHKMILLKGLMDQ